MPRPSLPSPLQRELIGRKDVGAVGRGKLGVHNRIGGSVRGPRGMVARGRRPRLSSREPVIPVRGCGAARTSRACRSGIERHSAGAAGAGRHGACVWAGCLDPDGVRRGNSLAAGGGLCGAGRGVQLPARRGLPPLSPVACRRIYPHPRRCPGYVGALDDRRSHGVSRRFHQNSRTSKQCAAVRAEEPRPRRRSRRNAPRSKRLRPLTAPRSRRETAGGQNSRRAGKGDSPPMERISVTLSSDL